jgi:hypothetical protein
MMGTAPTLDIATPEGHPRVVARASDARRGALSATHRAKVQLPDFFLVGAAKAGTTSLYHYLKGHPQVYMSPLKEPCYFATDIEVEKFAPDYRYDYLENPHEYIWGDMSEVVHLAYVKKYEDYVGLFRKVRDEKAIGEASVAYLWSERAAAEIKARIPEAKIIITLRNPIDRAFSHYQMDLKVGRVVRSFADELQDDLRNPDKGWCRSRMYLEHGLYFESVKRFLELFGAERVRIYFSQDLHHHRARVLGNLYDFLEVDPGLSPAADAIFNGAKVPRYPRINYWMYQLGLKRRSSFALIRRIRRRIAPMLYAPAPKLAASDRAMLAGFFKDDILKLQDLVGRDLSAWLR